MRVLRKKHFGVICAAILLVLPVHVYAQSSTSSSYRVDEATFSSGSNINANSSSYNARGSVGDLGVGEAGSTNFTAFAGPINPSEEYLELNVTLATVNLGTLNSSTTGTGTSTFYVRSYINGSYVVRTQSPPPTNGTYVLAGMSTTGASVQGTEQFGINLVANTSPVTQGANPSLQPDSNFANGVAATGYGTPNQYRYVQGEAIAQSGVGRAWGQTNYTISYIANVSPITPGGIFTANHDIIVIPTF